MTEVGGRGPAGWVLGLAAALVVLVAGLLIGRAAARRRARRGRAPSAPPPVLKADRPATARPRPAPGSGPAASVNGSASAAEASGAADAARDVAPVDGEQATGSTGKQPTESAGTLAGAEAPPDGTESDSALASLDSGRFLTSVPQPEAPRPVVMPTPRAAADDVRGPGRREPPQRPPPS